MIRLRTLGQIELTAGHGGDADALIAQPKRFALLCYLAIPKPGTMFRRDTLLGVFWPEGDSEHTRTALRQALAHIRKALGHDVIVRRGSEEVGLNPDLLWCDVGAFEKALDECKWSEAIESYRGELLKGLYVSHAPEFEHWLEAERARLAGRYAAALEELANAATAAGKTRAAVEWWQSLVLHDPYDSRYAMSLMEALGRAGDPANALLLARKHTELLREELDIAPSEEFEVLVERVREDPKAVRDVEIRPPVDGRRRDAEPEARWRRHLPMAFAVLAAGVLGVSALALRTWIAGSREDGATDTASRRLQAGELLDLTAEECVEAVEQVFYSRSSRERAHIPELLDRALGLEPELARAHAWHSVWLTNQAMEAPAIEVRDSALAEAERAVALDSTDWAGHMALGYTKWYAQDRYGQLQPLIRAVELAPNERGPRRALWVYYSNSGRVHLGRGWQVLESPAASATQHSQPLTAWLHCSLGDYQRAEQLVQTAIAVNPLPGSHEYLAKIYLSQGKVLEARGQIEHVLSDEGQSANHRRRQLTLAGLVEIAAGNHLLAQRHFEAALDIDPHTVVVPQNYLVTTTALGYVLLRQGENGRAREMLQRSMELDSEAIEHGHTYVALHQYDLARVHAIRGNISEANRWLKEALEHGWYYAYTYMGPRDPMLESVRGSAAFEQMMADARAELDRQREWIRDTETLTPDELLSMLMEEAYAELALLRGEAPIR